MSSSSSKSKTDRKRKTEEQNTNDLKRRVTQRTNAGLLLRQLANYLKKPTTGLDYARRILDEGVDFTETVYRHPLAHELAAWISCDYDLNFFINSCMSMICFKPSCHCECVHVPTSPIWPCLYGASRVSTVDLSITMTTRFDLLIDRGASVGDVGLEPEGETLLEFAFSNDLHSTVIDKLIAHGALWTNLALQSLIAVLKGTEEEVHSTSVANLAHGVIQGNWIDFTPVTALLNISSDSEEFITLGNNVLHARYILKVARDTQRLLRGDVFHLLVISFPSALARLILDHVQPDL